MNWQHGYEKEFMLKSTEHEIELLIKTKLCKKKKFPAFKHSDDA